MISHPLSIDPIGFSNSALAANTTAGVFYDFPAEHWIHLRTSNVIESSFATVRHRTDRTKGCLTRDGMLAMIFKLGMGAERSWKRLRGFQWLAKVIGGVKFRDGIEVQQGVRKASSQASRRIAA